ncbi:MAG: hypothetical protein M3Q39_00955 [Actinomycetota bacterium]|nr:hypothetical protein [Actinomycetota bacterium]
MIRSLVTVAALYLHSWRLRCYAAGCGRQRRPWWTRAVLDEVILLKYLRRRER